MCGLAGYLFNGVQADVAEAAAVRMANAMVHRGPDAAGVWVDEHSGVALAHRRLSIVDLSPAGHQPMVSPSGRYVLVFNGEIYNHLNLRAELQSAQSVPVWHGHSDTETLLASIDAWGLAIALSKTIGMFAIALWDRKERTLCLARDRMGEKPLYYGWQQGVFLFGSELKALKAHPSFEGEVDRNSLAMLLRHSCIPVPYSIYQGIHKLPPGTLLRLSGDGGRWLAGELPRPDPYWSLTDVVVSGQQAPICATATQAVAALDQLLLDSVRQQMVADVPLGAFLSGGIDSSTIVALMQAQSDRPVKTFTIGFHETGYNEAQHAKAVAGHLGTEHTELYVDPRDAMAVIPRLPTLYDEPFSDSSQIPTFIVSEMTRQHVKVSLSGDGGDELFGGYNRYVAAMNLLRKTAWMPLPIRQSLARALGALPVSIWDLSGRICGVSQGPEKMRKVIDVLGASTPDRVYRQLISHWKQPCGVVIGASEPPTLLTGYLGEQVPVEFEHRMMQLDALSYLPDDILVKVDRAAMGVSLETRVPFLDHRVVEFAWKLPLSMKIRNGQGKWILREVLSKYIPRNLIDRPKMGFGVPIDSWLRGPLRDWAEALLDESRLQQQGYFYPMPIRQKWQQHLSGQRNWQYDLWDVLMFQAWLELELES